MCTYRTQMLAPKTFYIGCALHKSDEERENDMTMLSRWYTGHDINPL
jgi:hypothetical protein